MWVSAALQQREPQAPPRYYVIKIQITKYNGRSANRVLAALLSPVLINPALRRTPNGRGAKLLFPILPYPFIVPNSIISIFIFLLGPDSFVLGEIIFLSFHLFIHLTILFFLFLYLHFINF